MKRNCRRMIGVFTVCCMLLTMLVVPAFADNPSGTKSIFADFDGMTYESALSAYGMRANMKVNAEGGAWESLADVDSTTDAQGNATDAVHFYWDNPETVTQTAAGTDPHLIVTSLDYSGAAVTSFDVKLDNDISRFASNYRYTSADGKTVMGLEFASGSVSAGMTLMGQPVNQPMEAGSWYHVTVATNYDEANNVITGSAWVNGVLLVEGVEIPYTLGADRINGNSSNMLRFWSYYNTAASDEKKPGIWVDNITFDQLGDDTVVTNPASGAIASDSTVKFTFGTDIDASTLDTSAITVSKNGEAVTPVSAELFYNRLSIKLSNTDKLDSGNYTVKLPAGVKDIFGYEIPESARTLSFTGYISSDTDDSVSVTSPATGSKLTYGKAVVLTASAAANAQVTFSANGTAIATVSADASGICSYTWTPNVYGEVLLTAEDSSGVSAPVSVNVMQETGEGYSFSPFGATTETSHTDGNDVTKSNVINISASGANINNSNLSVTSGIVELSLDVCTDESGTGANVSPLVYTESISSGTGKWLTGMVKMTQGTVTFLNSTITTVCAANTWYNIRAVIDMDNFIYSAYIDGKQIVNDVSFAVENDPITKMYRIKIEKAADGTVYCTAPYLSILTAVSMDYSAVITSPANGTILEKNQPITLTATATKADGATADALSFYQDSTKLGDASKQSDGTFAYTWTPTESGSKTIYAIATAGGKNFISDEIKVKVLGDVKTSWNTKLVTPNGGTVTKGDGTTVTEITHNLASDEKITMLYDSTSGTGAPFTQITTTSTKSGYIVAECDVTLSSTSATFALYNRNTGTSNYSQHAVILNGGKVYYYNKTTQVATTSTYTAGSPIHVKTLWNLDQQLVDIYIDNVRLPEQTIMRDDWTDVLYLRFASNAKDQAITLQNETVRYIPAEPEVSSVAVKNASGNVLNPLNMTAGNVASIDVTYNIALNSSTVTTDNVKLYRGSGTEAEVPVNVTLSEDGQTISVAPQDASTIVSGALYRLEVSDGIQAPTGGKADSVNYSFRTLIEGRGAENGVFKKSEIEINSILGLTAGDVITFTADVTDSVAEKNVWVILAVYGNSESGKVLKDISITKQGLSSVQTEVSGSLKLTNDTEYGDTLYGYVWTSGLVPFGDEFPLN